MTENEEYYRVTVRGIKLKVRKDTMDDIDMVEDLGALQDGDIFALPRVLKRMFGDEYDVVKDRLANEHHITKVSDMTAFFEEVLFACNALDAKN